MTNIEKTHLCNEVSKIKAMLREVDFCLEQAYLAIHTIENNIIDSVEDSWEMIGNSYLYSEGG